MTERRRIAVPVVLTTVGLIVVLGLHPVSTERIVAGYVLVLAAIGLASVTRALAAVSWHERASRFDYALSRRPVERTRPSELVRIEREITLGTTSAGHLDARLLPLLRGAAEARLGLDFALQPDRARKALGEDTWELLRPDRPAPVERNAPGLPLRRVREIVASLEQL